MKTDILVTVLMPVYNEEIYIDDAIQSILGQSYKNFEFIIIDDASTDSTLKKIMNYSDERIVLIQNETNQGLTKNLNTGLKMAKGKYILRMDGDDISLPERFKEQVNFMEKHPKVALSGGFMKRFGVSHETVKAITDPALAKVNMIFDSVVYHPTFIMRKEFMDIHKIIYNESIRYAQDYMFAYQVSRKGIVTNLSTVLLKYRTHKRQISFKKMKDQTKYANLIRKKILEDLDIRLNHIEFQLWCDFCINRERKLSCRDVIWLNQITDLIIAQNHTKCIYNEKRLQNCLESKLNNYYRSNIQIVKQLYYVKEWIANKMLVKKGYFERY